MNKLSIGLLAGVIATVPMTITMFAIRKFIPKRESDPLPPHRVTTEIAKAIGLEKKVDTPAHHAVTWVSHFGYGAAAGAVYTPLEDKVEFPPVVAGVLYGLGVWAGSYLGWLPEMGLHRSATQEPARRNGMMIAAHIVWGATLGTVTDALESASRL